MKKFIEDVVLVDVNANITSPKNFDQLETTGLSTHSLSSDSVYPDIISTARDAIRLDVSDIVNGTMVFETISVNRNVKVSKLNDQPFPSGFVTLDTDQELPDSMVIDKVIMLGDIILEDGARVNGFDLKAECENTWMVTAKNNCLFEMYLKPLVLNRSMGTKRLNRTKSSKAKLIYQETSRLLRK